MSVDRVEHRWLRDPEHFRMMCRDCGAVWGCYSPAPSVVRCMPPMALDTPQSQPPRPLARLRRVLGM